MYYAIGVFAPSLYRESTDSLIFQRPTYYNAALLVLLGLHTCSTFSSGKDMTVLLIYQVLQMKQSTVLLTGVCSECILLLCFTVQKTIRK